jgi:phosphopantothenoylcysteine decarboxylase/phosphopantothenate--cysteine ligase
MKVLITAGPTHEPIDPVRFIGNRSSGKMGIEIANKFNKESHEVYLVIGPTQYLNKVKPQINIIQVETASEMYEKCLEHSDADIIICSAAVADYRVKNLSTEKIKKEGSLTLELEKNVDILYELGQNKRPGQTLVGFALETSNLIEYAKGKITKKNLDYIVANYADAFNSDLNKVTIIDKDSNITEYDKKTKVEIATDIYNRIVK